MNINKFFVLFKQDLYVGNLVYKLIYVSYIYYKIMMCLKNRYKSITYLIYKINDDNR